jgi:hypothetical protein
LGLRWAAVLIVVVAMGGGIVLGVAALSAWAAAGSSQEPPVAEESPEFANAGPITLQASSILSSFPEHARAEFDDVVVDLVRSTNFAEIYIGAGSDNRLCLIVSYSADSQAASCVGEDVAAEQGLILVGFEYLGDPVEVVAVVPSDTVAAYLGDDELTIEDLVIAERVDTSSMILTLETEGGSSSVDYSAEQLGG